MHEVGGRWGGSNKVVELKKKGKRVLFNSVINTFFFSLSFVFISLAFSFNIHQSILKGSFNTCYIHFTWYLIEIQFYIYSSQKEAVNSSRFV